MFLRETACDRAYNTVRERLPGARGHCRYIGIKDKCAQVFTYDDHFTFSFESTSIVLSDMNGQKKQTIIYHGVSKLCSKTFITVTYSGGQGQGELPSHSNVGEEVGG